MTDRPSRQDLVVSPQTSSLRFAVAAGGSACIGFAMVWGAIVVGQTFLATPVGEDAGRVGIAPVTEAPADMPVGGQVAAAPTAPSDPFAIASSTPLPSDVPVRHTSGFAATAPDHQGSAGDPPDYRSGEGTGRAVRPSRFGDADAGPADAPEFAAGGIMAVAALDEPSGAAAATIDTLAGDAAMALPLDEVSADDLPVETAAAPLPEDRGDLGIVDAAPPMAALAPAGDTLDDPPTVDAHLPDPPPALSVAPVVAPPAAMPPALERAPAPFPDVAPSAPNTGARAAAWNNGAGMLDDPGAPVPATALPRAASSPSPSAATMPFAAAPPIANQATPADAVPGPGAAPAPSPAAGQGRPGPIHLEGVQTPQLAVEKRGPREIQVGKTARFEIIVRNVGSAQANDVVLRDSVPFGTALVATTPPAAPAQAGGDAGELVWLLDALPPGGQVRVGVDLMPLSEGDVGSVASVSFRADASVRTRATRPALEITAQPPSPVLVGGESRLTITISNPGSGVATGVILESIVPDGLAHRAGRELEFDVGTLPPGESRSIDLVLATTGPGTHGLRLSARADGQIEVNDTVKVAVTSPTLDLAVAMPSRRYLQRPATCTISMTNAGTAPAMGVELVAQLPPGLKFVRANNSGYYEERTHRVLWNLEELPAAETGEVEVVLMPVALGPQKIVMAARTPSGLSDQIAHTVEVEGLAALTFEVADSEDPIEVGGVSEYVIRVANQGTKAAGGVRVVATLLGDLEPVEARGPSPHRVENLTVSFEPLAKLAPSEEALYRLRVRGRREGDQRVQVQLTSDEQPAPLTKEETTRVYADR